MTNCSVNMLDEDEDDEDDEDEWDANTTKLRDGEGIDLIGHAKRNAEAVRRARQWLEAEEDGDDE